MADSDDPTGAGTPDDPMNIDPDAAQASYDQSLQDQPAQEYADDAAWAAQQPGAAQAQADFDASPDAPGIDAQAAQYDQSQAPQAWPGADDPYTNAQAQANQTRAAAQTLAQQQRDRVNQANADQEAAENAAHQAQVNQTRVQIDPAAPGPSAPPVSRPAPGARPPRQAPPVAQRATPKPSTGGGGHKTLLIGMGFALGGLALAKLWK